MTRSPTKKNAIKDFFLNDAIIQKTGIICKGNFFIGTGEEQISYSI
jgi:hypothetical protein